MNVFLMRSWTHHEPKRPRGTPGVLSSGHKPPAGMAAVMLHVGNIPVTEDVTAEWIVERLKENGIVPGGAELQLEERR